jgi:hypothetical protein
MLNTGSLSMSLLAVKRKGVSLVAVCATVLALAGCQGIVSSRSSSQVRIIVASPNAPSVDIYQNSSAMAYNLGFGTLTSYVPVNPGTYTTTATQTGSRQMLSSSKATYDTGAQYTVLIGNTAGSLQQLTLKDQSQPAPAGQISLRFIDQATRIPGQDIYMLPPGQKLTAVTPIYTNITFGANTSYLNIPTGVYTLVMVPTGTIPATDTIATYTGPQVTYTEGSATTIILVDQQIVTTPGLQVITASDYSSPPANE